jgi:hypothetical protein
VTIPAGYLGGSIDLVYRVWDDRSSSWWGWFVSGTSVSTSLQYPGIFDGRFINDVSDGKVYVGLDGELRHIYSQLTLICLLITIRTCWPIGPLVLPPAQF